MSGKIWRKQMEKIAGKDFNKYALDTDIVIGILKEKIKQRNYIIGIFATFLAGSVAINILLLITGGL